MAASPKGCPAGREGWKLSSSLSRSNLSLFKKLEPWLIPQDHVIRYAVVLHDYEIRIAVAVAIGQAKEPDIRELQGGIKAVAPVIP